MHHVSSGQHRLKLWSLIVYISTEIETEPASLQTSVQGIYPGYPRTHVLRWSFMLMETGFPEDLVHKCTSVSITWTSEASAPHSFVRSRQTLTQPPMGSFLLPYHCRQILAFAPRPRYVPAGGMGPYTVCRGPPGVSGAASQRARPSGSHSTGCWNGVD